MRSISHLALLLLIGISSNLYSQIIKTGPFHKVTISPYIAATFVPGDEERVVINNIMVDSSKLNVETKDGTLRIYLDGAKEVPHNTKENKNTGRDLYPVHAVSATVYYKKLDALSLRGSESFVCPERISAERFSLTLYGESEITFAEVHIKDLHTIIYGESSVDLQSGSVEKQTYTCYGEGKVNGTAVSCEQAKLTAYGEAEFNLNVSERIKITSFGESKLRYKGNAQIVKGINMGGVDVAKLD